MDGTRPPPAREDEPTPPPVAPRIVATARPRQGRVREALRCPFCHDQVTRADIVACARRGCGALYHRECWEECARFDGCAALACGSRDAREVSALGYLVRVLRLVVAALLFPRRVARALREQERTSPVSLFRQARTLAWRVVPKEPELRPLHTLYILAVAFPLVLALGLAPPLLAVPVPVRVVLMPVLGIVLGMYVVPLLLALLGTLGFLGLRALGRAFVSELAALGRADAPAIRTPRLAPEKDVP